MERDTWRTSGFHLSFPNQKIFYLEITFTQLFYNSNSLINHEALQVLIRISMSMLKLIIFSSKKNTSEHPLNFTRTPNLYTRISHIFATNKSTIPTYVTHTATRAPHTYQRRSPPVYLLPRDLLPPGPRFRACFGRGPAAAARASSTLEYLQRISRMYFFFSHAHLAC